MTQTVIVDIDGTLADLTHRLHHVTNGNRRWDLFETGVVDDKPITQIIDLVRALFHTYRIVLVSGRSDATREATEAWLDKHSVPYLELHMRRAGDHRQDFIIKEEILDDLIKNGHDIAFVVDDRPSVVAMWRKRGITCLQCAEWEENKKPKVPKGKLFVMVGPSGAGKSRWALLEAKDESRIVSSDTIRWEFTGDFRIQDKNVEVFNAFHAIITARINAGLDTYADATHIKRADRLATVKCADGGEVEYIVINRPLADKKATGGWRNQFGLIEKHDSTFRAQLKDILRGDGLPNVIVRDLRDVGN